MYTQVNKEHDQTGDPAFAAAALTAHTAANDHAALHQATIDKLFPPTIMENWATLQYRHYRRPRPAEPVLDRQAVIAVTDKIIQTENQLFADQRKRLQALQQAHRAELHALRTQVDHDEQLLTYERQRLAQITHELGQIRERLRVCMTEVDGLKHQRREVQHQIHAMQSTPQKKTGTRTAPHTAAPTTESLSLVSALITALAVLTMIAVIPIILLVIFN